MPIGSDIVDIFKAMQPPPSDPVKDDTWMMDTFVDKLKEWGETSIWSAPIVAGAVSGGNFTGTGAGGTIDLSEKVDGVKADLHAMCDDMWAARTSAPVSPTQSGGAWADAVDKLFKDAEVSFQTITGTVTPPPPATPFPMAGPGKGKCVTAAGIAALKVAFIAAMSLQDDTAMGQAMGLALMAYFPTMIATINGEGSIMGASGTAAPMGPPA